MYRKPTESLLMTYRRLRTGTTLLRKSRQIQHVQDANHYTYLRLSTAIVSPCAQCVNDESIRTNLHRVRLKYDITRPKHYSQSTAENDISKLKLESMDLTKVDNHEERILERLNYLMEMMEVEKAVKLLKMSAKLSIIPRKETLLNLIQQIANLGEYTSLLELYKLIKDGELFSSLEFFEQLKLAYFQIQRIDEAVIMLRIIYHGLRKYQEVDLLFTSICMMILRHFPSEIYLIQSFVDDCMNAEKGQKNFRPAAGLWKCYILNEDLQGSSRVLELSDDIAEFLPDMVRDILNDTNKIDHNRGDVLYSLVQMKELPVSHEEHKTLVKECLLALSENSKWTKLLQVLQSVTDSDANKDVLERIISQMERSGDKDFELVLCLEEATNMLKNLGH